MGITAFNLGLSWGSNFISAFLIPTAMFTSYSVTAVYFVFFSVLPVPVFVVTRPKYVFCFSFSANLSENKTFKTIGLR